MIAKLQHIRNRLLEENLINEYKAIMNFFDTPIEDDVNYIVSVMPDILKLEVSEALNEIIYKYESEILKYRYEIVYGQRLIWSYIMECYESLLKVKDKMFKMSLIIDDDDYLIACNEIKKIFDCYAEAQIVMTKFEDVLGIDRYLDKLCDSDLKPLEVILSDIKSMFENKVKPYKEVFVRKWSTTNIPEIITHELIRYNGNSQICTLFECEKKSVVLFIIDGFGYGQYKWNKKINKGVINYTYNENIFEWLDKSDCIKEYMLGTAYISDTGAGLAQIFSGKAAIETGIISSKIGKINSSSFIDTKKIDINSFENIFQSETSSITELVNIFEKKSKVYYGSKYERNISGFSDFIFKGAEITEVLPQERMFSILKDELYEHEDSLDVVYLTGIDNSGHTMGAYSKFEKYEHEKFNMLFRNFLIEMAIEKPENFNGDTSIILTADHGMAESSKLMLSRKVIKERFYASNIRGANFIENNRALLVYELNKSNYNAALNCLNTYFKENQIEVDIIIKGTEEYKKWYCLDNDNKISNLAPDIVIRLISNGLFYSKETSPHLLHYGGHGGGSAGELFVPLLQITLNDKLLKNIIKRFINIM